MSTSGEPNAKKHLPNLLSLSRIVLGLLIFFLLRKPLAVTAGLCLAFIGAGMITDYLDGTLARRNNTVTLAGKWIDPLSDFTFFLFVYLSFYLLGLMPLVLLLLFLGREISMYTVVRPLYYLRGMDPAAKIPGKIKTVFQNIGSAVITFLVLLHRLQLLGLGPLRSVSLVLLSLMVAMSLISMYWYVKPLVADRRSRSKS